MQALAFVVTTFLISWTEQYFIIKGDGIQNSTRAFALMWTPGLVGLFYSLFFDRNFKALGIKLPNIKSLLIAYFIPALTAVIIVGCLVMFKITDFQINPELIEKKGGLSNFLIAALLVAPTVGMIVSFISGLGEELGWRGLLHTKLQFLNPNRRYLLTGFIWSVWHWPLIIFGDYATSDKPFLNLFFFTVAVVGLSFLMGLLRDKTGSVFPAALVHGSHNMWILGISPAFFKASPLIPYFGGESGLFCAAVYLAMAVVIYKRQNTVSEKDSLCH